MVLSYYHIIVLIAFVSLGFAVREILPIHYTNSLLDASTGRCENTRDYVAAVVEYKPIPIGNQTPLGALMSNVEAYLQLIKAASNKDVDMIVFPEYGITTIALPPQRDKAREYFVDIVEIGVTPCENETINSKNFEVLYSISCSAREHNMYVIVNLGEIEYCQGDDNRCPEDGAFHFNTNVVFDRYGSIIARYRKFHLYFEPQFDYPQLEYSFFQTDFGVEFGLLTCFDIIFANPAVEMVATKGIRNFAFPTAWVDELPFLTAIQAQSLWAQSNQVNLLASGYHNPERGSMGSGIYSGEYGPLDYVFDPDSGTQMVVSRVPISQTETVPGYLMPRTAKDANTSHFWLREDLSNYSLKRLDSGANSDMICHDDFCCHFEYDLGLLKDTTGELKIIAFHGNRTVAAKRDWFLWQVCAVVHCLNTTIESCTENNFGAPAPQFKSLSINMTPVKLEYENDRVSKPALSLLDSSFNLIPQQYFTLDHGSNENNVPFATASLKNSSNLANFEVKTIALIQKIYAGRL